MSKHKEGIVPNVFDWGQLELKRNIEPPDEADLNQIRKILAFVDMQRTLREAIFDGNVVNEQSWTILQTIFAHHLRSDRPMRTKDVWQLTSVPETTLLRYLQHLEQFKLIKREPDPNDARVTLVRLTRQGRDWMFEYFGQLIHLDRQAAREGNGLFSRT